MEMPHNYCSSTPGILDAIILFIRCLALFGCSHIRRTTLLEPSIFAVKAAGMENEIQVETCVLWSWRDSVISDNRVSTYGGTRSLASSGTNVVHGSGKRLPWTIPGNSEPSCQPRIMVVTMYRDVRCCFSSQMIRVDPPNNRSRQTFSIGQQRTYSHRDCHSGV
jgi:hypothetical protein